MTRRSAVFMMVLGAFVLGGAGRATAGDHLKCYKVKDKERTQVDPENKKRPVTEASNTGLGSDSGCVVDNRKAKICCDAVTKDGGPETGSTIHNRFCCYKLTCAKPYANASAHVGDQFRNGNVTLTKPAYICAPGL
jgi:hypothetical protein